MFGPRSSFLEIKAPFIIFSFDSLGVYHFLSESAIIVRVNRTSSKLVHFVGVCSLELSLRHDSVVKAIFHGRYSAMPGVPRELTSVHTVYHRDDSLKLFESVGLWHLSLLDSKIMPSLEVRSSKFEVRSSKFEVRSSKFESNALQKRRKTFCANNDIFFK